MISIMNILSAATVSNNTLDRKSLFLCTPCSLRYYLPFSVDCEAWTFYAIAMILILAPIDTYVKRNVSICVCGISNFVEFVT